MASLYQRTPGVEFQRIDDEAVLLDMSSGHYYRLNSTGASIWELLGSPLTVDDLSERLTDMYQPGEDVHPQVKQTLDVMLHSGLVQLSG